MAVTSTRIPMPPSQWVKARQKRMPREQASISVRIEAPVVVKPEKDSNTQSAKLANWPDSQKGSAPPSPTSSQISPTEKKPSLA